MDDTTLGLIIVALITSISGLGLAFINRIKPKTTDQTEALVLLRIDVARLIERNRVKDNELEVQLIKAIHEPDTPKLDRLLAKVQADILNKTDNVTILELQESKRMLNLLLSNLARDGKVETPKYLTYAQMLSFIEVRILEKSWHLSK